MVDMTARLDQSMRVGNEGAGVVVEAGANAQALLGKTVSAAAGAMFSQFRVLKAHEVIALPDGHHGGAGRVGVRQPDDGAVHARDDAARGPHRDRAHRGGVEPRPDAGQAVRQDGVGLVNIVRSAEHVKLLKELGAEHVLDSTSPTFAADLVEACVATKATIAFDAIGGGTLASQILTAMELGRESHDEDVQPLRLGDAQAGLHLRLARRSTDDARPHVRAVVGRRRLARVARAPEARPRGRHEAARARARRADDDVREPLHRDDLAARRDQARRDLALREACDRREVPDRPEQVDDATIAEQDSTALTLSRLQRAFTTQIDSLSNMRRGGRQKVVVEHVHVYPGGQAIVGDVTHVGRGVSGENAQQAHATDDKRTLAFAPGAEMRCTDQEREALPVAGGERQEALPDARGSARLRSAEGGAQRELSPRLLHRRGNRRTARGKGPHS